MQKVFDMMKAILPKSDVQTLTIPTHEVFRNIQQLLPNLRAGAIRAGNGLDGYIACDAGWIDELPIRHSIALMRFTHEIQDLGAETWRNLSKLQQHRKAYPDLCVC